MKRTPERAAHNSERLRPGGGAARTSAFRYRLARGVPPSLRSLAVGSAAFTAALMLVHTSRTVLSTLSDR